MKDLIGFSLYLKNNRLREFATEYLRIVMSLDIPLVKLVIERNLVPRFKEETGIEMTMVSLDKFLASLVNNTVFDNALKGLELWENDKLPYGLSKGDIHPSDLVLVYVAQKTALYKFLPSYCDKVDESVSIMAELENYYMKVQNDAIQMLFKIQKEIEIKLGESEENFRLIVQGVKDYAIFLLDSVGNIQSWNEGIQRLKGYSREEIIGRHFSIFYTNEERMNGKPARDLETAIKNGGLESEGWRVRKDGSQFWGNTVITALYDENGELKGFSKITRDVTEMKKAREQLESKALELERSNKELEQFAYVASHDLQEPLRTVSSYLQLLASRYKDKLDKDAGEFIEYAVDGSNRMRELINSLLEYSRINRVKPFEEVNVTDIINEVLLDMKEQINFTGAIIKYDNMPEIYCDSILIGRLFQNLIGNALKFRSDKKPKIVISSEKQNGEYLFSVKDNGIGIQKEYWDKIFIIFQRLNNRKDYPGTGIGLSVCKKIAERHGGKIWVESEPGKGTTFYFTIKKHNDKRTSVGLKQNAKQY